MLVKTRTHTHTYLRSRLNNIKEILFPLNMYLFIIQWTQQLIYISMLTNWIIFENINSILHGQQTVSYCQYWSLGFIFCLAIHKYRYFYITQILLRYISVWIKDAIFFEIILMLSTLWIFNHWNKLNNNYSQKI